MAFFVRDVLTQPLYDTARCEPGRRTVFFAVPVGMGQTLFGAGPKHFGDTNQFLPNQLPAGWQFSVDGLYLEVLDLPECPYNLAALAGAVAHLRIGARRYLNLPATALRASLEITGGGAEAARDIADQLAGIAPAALPMVLGPRGRAHLPERHPAVPGLTHGKHPSYPPPIA